EHGADLLRVASAPRTCTDHLLHRNHIRVDAANNVGDAIGTRATVEAATTMDVVRRDADRAAVVGAHYAMIVRSGTRTRAGAAVGECGGGRLLEAAAGTAEAGRQHPHDRQPVERGMEER